MTKFTKGPWVVSYPVNRNHPWIEAALNFTNDADGKEVYMSVSGLCSEADANLIAAAPDMFETLTECLALFDCVTALDDHGSKSLGQAENLIRAALAKAEGRTLVQEAAE